jgi:hypothetical protein
MIFRRARAAPILVARIIKTEYDGSIGDGVTGLDRPERRLRAFLCNTLSKKTNPPMADFVFLEHSLSSLSIGTLITLSNISLILAYVFGQLE